MTADERIESVLNKANNTISDLPEDLIMGYSSEACATILRKALESCGIELTGEDDTITIGEAFTSLCGYGLHLSDVIERLVWALENTVEKYDKAKYRLWSWGDIHYVADLEEGKL